MRSVQGKEGLEEVAIYASLRTIKNGENEINLYSMGKYCLAVGENADLLYMKFGWEIDEFLSKKYENYSVPYAVVTADGLRLLQRKGIKVTVWNADYEYDGADADDKMKTVKVQQFLDLIRAMQQEDGLFEYPVIKQDITYFLDGYERKARLSRISISKYYVTVRIDNTEDTDLYTYDSWKSCETSVYLYRALASVIDSQHDIILSMAESPASVQQKQREDNAVTYGIFMEKKKANPGKVILVKEKGFFITCDDDAILVSDKLSKLLYNFPVGVSKSHTAAILDAAEFSDEYDINADTQVACGEGRDIYQLGLSESVLNIPVNEDIQFTEIAIFKKSSKDYAIRAAIKDKTLPVMPLPSAVGSYYQTLPENSRERQKWLTVMAHKSYDNMLNHNDEGEN